MKSKSWVHTQFKNEGAKDATKVRLRRTTKMQKLKKRKKSGNRNVSKRNREGEAKKSQSHCSLVLIPQSGGKW
jgi:hypothetical protein